MRGAHSCGNATRACAANSFAFPLLQARQTMEVEAAPLLAPVAGGQRGRGLPPSGPDHSNEPIDWLMTSLLFFFPAVGGLLFGWVDGCGWLWVVVTVVCCCLKMGDCCVLCGWQQLACVLDRLAGLQITASETSCWSLNLNADTT